MHACFVQKIKVLEIYKREVLLKKRLLLNPLLVSNVRLAMQLKKKSLSKCGVVFKKCQFVLLDSIFQ